MAMVQEPPVEDGADEQRLRSALSRSARPARPNAFAVSLTLAWRVLLKIKHVPEQLFDVVMFPIMFTVMFTYLFGGALAGSTSEYLQYLLPGILVQTVVFITIYTGVGLNTDIKRGIFDRFRTLPIWQPAPLVGALMGDVLRYSMASTIVIAVGMLLGFRPGGGIVGVVLAVALLLAFAFSLSWVWILVGMKARTPESVMYGSMLLLFPLTFASNIFVDPRTMPGWLEAVVERNPVSVLATAARNLMHGADASSEVLWVFVACAVLLVAFVPIVLRTYGSRS